MDEKTTQNLPRKYKHIRFYRVEDENIDFKQLRKNLKALSRYQDSGYIKDSRHKDTLFILTKEGESSDKNKYYAYDYLQRRKTSIDQLKLINNSDAAEIIAVLTGKKYDTKKKFVDTYGYPHTYFSRMDEGAWFGSVGGGICGVVLAVIAGYFLCMAVFGFFCLVPHIVAAIGGIALLSLAAMACIITIWPASILLGRILGIVGGALHHYVEKPSVELKLQNQPENQATLLLIEEQQSEPIENSSIIFSSPLTQPTTHNSHEADEDTLKWEDFRKSFNFLNFIRP